MMKKSQKKTRCYSLRQEEWKEMKQDPTQLLRKSLTQPIACEEQAQSCSKGLVPGGRKKQQTMLSE